MTSHNSRSPIKRDLRGESEQKTNHIEIGK